MKHWLETRQVLDRLIELQAGGRRAALATVVRVRGSAYRRPGAKLLVSEDGSCVGNVSGGCLEADVREVGLQVIRTGQPRMRSYCSGADEISAWDLGVGCEGEVQVFVEPVEEPVGGERGLLDDDAPFAVCTVVAEDRSLAERGRLLVTSTGSTGTLGAPARDAASAALARRLADGGSSGIHEIVGRAVFIDGFAPPPRLVIVGAGEDARPLAALALGAGFRVLVVDRRAGLLSPDRFPPDARLVLARAEEVAAHLPLDARSYVVVMTHSYADDEGYLRGLVRAPLAYLGILGPRQRTDRLLRALDAEAPLDESRIYAPIGLDLGTEGAEQVAVSIVAEMLSVRSGRSATPLRERREPIHSLVGSIP